MTARPMTDQERALKIATGTDWDYADCVAVARALLSSSSAERGMRTKLVIAAMSAQLPPNYQWGEDAMEAFNFGKACAANAVEAALAPAGEDEQATRGEDAATASTDN